MDNMEFVGVCVSTTTDTPPVFHLAQRDYAERLTRLPFDAPYKTFISSRENLAWLAPTKPDLCSVINMAARTTEDE